MSDVVRVESIDALKHFRVALFKFQEAANSALSDAESEMFSTLRWLENEQLSHWQTQIRKRHELLERAKEALRMKKLFKDSSGRYPSAVEEEKAVRLCQSRLEEANEKLVATKKYARVLQRELQVYKGSVQRFATTVQSDIPVAAATLDSLVESLEAYVALTPGADATAAAPVGSESPAPPPPPTEESQKEPNAST
jgi:hypothetical protein